MSTVQSPDYSPHIINGIHEVASQHVGKAIVNIIRNCFPSGKIRSGNYYLRRSHTMILQYFLQLEVEDQDTIHREFVITADMKEKLEDGKRSVFKRFSLAKDYERVAKNLFIIVESASHRAASKNLMAQISEAIAARAPQLGTTTTLSDPFSDSHAASTLTDIDVGNLNQLEVSTYHSEARGEAAVVIALQGRDATTQEILGMIPLEVFPGDRTDEQAETRTVSSYDTVGHGLYGTEVGDDADR
ncbi:hypothetical protein EDB92DRAFT_549349 [Lactarius akahatsu]|uniref:Uncharacterized protein n=1 Tax=Lactarius akahatsu TaxID=416441 RepID=A0AAD4Q2K3_9AGAM|nr:hypothetical protein EDB92DRAFT_549349 [Lactarius akahatsu]